MNKHSSEYYDVFDMICECSTPKNRPWRSTFRVEYRVRIDDENDYRIIDEFFCFDHGGVPAKIARDRWEKITGRPGPESVQVALERSYQIPTPKKIRVLKNDGGFFEIIERIYDND